MSDAYVRRGEEPANTAGILLAAVSLFSTLLLIAAIFYATGIGARRKALLAAGDCAPVPSLVRTGLDCTTEPQLYGQYTKITGPAIQELNADAAAYAVSEWRNLDAAETALKAEVTSATALAASLARFPFPSPDAALGRALVAAIDARTALTARQAQSSSLTQLRKFNQRLARASDAVRARLRLIRKALRSQPTANQEP
jgi:hypothetical protein